MISKLLEELISGRRLPLWRRVLINSSKGLQVFGDQSQRMGLISFFLEYRYFSRLASAHIYAEEIWFHYFLIENQWMLVRLSKAHFKWIACARFHLLFFFLVNLYWNSAFCTLYFNWFMDFDFSSMINAFSFLQIDRFPRQWSIFFSFWLIWATMVEMLTNLFFYLALRKDAHFLFTNTPLKAEFVLFFCFVLDLFFWTKYY